MRHFALHGLVAASEIELDLWDSGGPRPRAPDTVVRWQGRRTVPDEEPAGELVGFSDDGTGARQVSVAGTGQGFVLRYHRFAEIAVDSALSAATVVLDPSAGDDAAGTLVTGGLGGFLVTMSSAIRGSGGVALHASAVGHAGTAVLFAGGSGSGKSTLAALCCLSGASLLTDDTARVEVGGSGAVCFPGTRSVRLRAGVADLAERAHGIQRTATSDKRIAARMATERPDDPLEPVAVTAVVVPRDPVTAEGGGRRRGGRLVTRLSSHDALVALLPHSRTPNLTHREAVTRHFAVCAELARNVPVYSLVLPARYWRDSCLARDLLAEVGSGALVG